jgi:hypothetical protein
MLGLEDEYRERSGYAPEQPAVPLSVKSWRGSAPAKRFLLWHKAKPPERPPRWRARNATQITTTAAPASRQARHVVVPGLLVAWTLWIFPIGHEP